MAQGADSWWWREDGRRWRCHGERDGEDDGEKMEVLRRGGSAVSGEFQWWPARLAAAAAVEGGRETRVRVSCVRWRG